MNITKDIIADLYPLYAENECSADTRALVADYLARHPQEAETLRRAATTSLPVLAPSPAQLAETQSLREARRRVRRRAWWMGLALFFSLARSPSTWAAGHPGGCCGMRREARRFMPPLGWRCGLPGSGNAIARNVFEPDGATVPALVVAMETPRVERMAVLFRQREFLERNPGSSALFLGPNDVVGSLWGSTTVPVGFQCALATNLCARGGPNTGRPYAHR